MLCCLNHSDLYGIRVQDREICLNHPDVSNIVAIYESLDLNAPILDKLTFTSTDASTVETVTVESVDNDILVIDGKNTNFIGFDTTPQSISNGAGATATIIENVDLADFGAEIRMIGSACVYGNFGIYGDGPGIIVYAIGQNLAYIGNGKEVTNDPGTVIQANEVVELNNAKVRYNSVDHKGDFRVGELFYVNQDDGTVSFTANALTVDLTTGATFTTGGDTSFINGSRIDVGNLRLTGNTLSSTVGDINFDSSSGVINLLDNVDITGNLDVSGDVTIGGNVTIGDESTDSIEIVAGINSNLVPSSTSTFSLGTNTNSWSKLWVSELQVDDVNINTNVITTTSSNADLELRANGTGSVVAEGFTFETNNISTTGDMVFEAGSELINFNSSGAIRLPTGTTAQRTSGVAGELRYNSELARFEGFNGTNWFNLKGVEDLNGDTRITAELTEGANDDIIRFYVKNDVVFSVDTNGFNANQIEIENEIANLKNDNSYKTLAFDESVLGWTSFYSYKPDFLVSLENKFYSFKKTTNDGEGIWLQNSGNYSEFYNQVYNSDVTVILNKEPSLVKNFKTINYEGASGWEIDSITTSSGDTGSPISPYLLPSSTNLNTLSALESNIFINNFKRKENKFFANLINTSPATPGEILFGASSTGLKGFWSTVKLKLVFSTLATDPNYYGNKKELFAVSSDIVESSY